MNPLTRTIENLVETNINGVDADTVAHKKAFTAIKYVTGKSHSTINDYNVEKHNTYYGYDTIVISGQRGFMRVTLEPLFQLID